MSEIATGLQAEVDRLESLFIGKLIRLGMLDLADEFRDITALRHATAVVNRRSPKGRSPRVNGGNVFAEGTIRIAPPAGFVLTDEVRKAIREIKSERFRVSTVFEILESRWPEYITEDKRASIGATLSNFVASGELTSEKDGQRKVWYRVANLRGENAASEAEEAEEIILSTIPSVFAADDDIPF